VQRLWTQSGLGQPLGATLPSPIRQGDAASAAQRRRTASLEAELESRSRSTIDLERLQAALSWYLDFQRDTGIRAFIDPDDENGKRYNQRTLELFALYIHNKGSRQRQRVGTHIAANTSAAYVSTLKTAVARAQGRPLTDDSYNVHLPRLIKSWRREQRPNGDLGSERKLCRGIRAGQLMRAALAGFDRTSREGTTKWAAALLAHNLLSQGRRGGTN
tara:strand:+ start:205 stop:855 length:651 start_codon:yes stop_codon:yes gene_type:complete